MSNRYQATFAALKAQQKGAFVPFVTIGDPGLELSLKIIQTLVDNGADALELGFPFSDPLADGPVIQGANLRSLAAGTKPDDCFELIAKIRAQHPDLPIGLLLYANLVFANGIDAFYAKAQAAGMNAQVNQQRAQTEGMLGTANLNLDQQKSQQDFISKMAGARR